MRAMVGVWWCSVEYLESGLWKGEEEVEKDGGDERGDGDYGGDGPKEDNEYAEDHDDDGDW